MAGVILADLALGAGLNSLRQFNTEVTIIMIIVFPTRWCLRGFVGTPFRKQLSQWNFCIIAPLMHVRQIDVKNEYVKL